MGMVRLIFSRRRMPKSVSCFRFSWRRARPAFSESTRAKKLLPKAMSKDTAPYSSSSRDRFSRYRKEGTFRMLTSTARPRSTFTRARMRPTGASSTTSV